MFNLRKAIEEKQKSIEAQERLHRKLLQLSQDYEKYINDEYAIETARRRQEYLEGLQKYRYQPVPFSDQPVVDDKFFEELLKEFESKRDEKPKKKKRKQSAKKLKEFLEDVVF